MLATKGKTYTDQKVQKNLEKDKEIVIIIMAHYE